MFTHQIVPAQTATTSRRAGKRFVADLRCIHCARLVGTWVWEAGAPQGVGIFRTMSGASRTDLLWRVRCSNCGGPVYAEESEEVREPEVVAWGPEKRGRKPKQRAA